MILQFASEKFTSSDHHICPFTVDNIAYIIDGFMLCLRIIMTNGDDFQSSSIIVSVRECTFLRRKSNRHLHATTSVMYCQSLILDAP